MLNDFFCLYSFLDKEHVENLLGLLKENDSRVKPSQPLTTAEPMLTHVEVHNIDRDIAKNLALYGNPFGDLRRSGQKIKMS